VGNGGAAEDAREGVKAALPLASFKLRFHDVHVRAVPRLDAEGCPFRGPGVDLRGEAARAVLEAAAPMLAWLDAREPGVSRSIRSVSSSRAPDGTPLKVIVTLEAEDGERPRVVRIDPPHVAELAAAAREVEELIGSACVDALRRRGAGEDRR